MKLIEHVKFENEGKIREVRILEDEQKRRFVNVIFEYNYNAPYSTSISSFETICNLLIANGFNVTYILNAENLYIEGGKK